MSQVLVSALTSGNEDRWDGFVADHPDANLFQRAAWRRVIARAYGHKAHYLMARRAGSICGVLPLIEIRSPLFGYALTSIGFFVYGGILATDTAAAAALADAAVRLGKELGVAHIELRSERALLSDWATKAGTYATFRRGLEDTEAAALQSIPRKKRADIRKSLSADLIVETGIPPAAFHAVYAESVRNLGTPVFPRCFIHSILSEFADITELSLVRRGGTPLAALLTFYFKDQVLPYFGGAVPAARPLHAYDLLYWSLMRRAVARGVRTFDFGRSKYGTGAFDYKRFWGFEPTPLAYQYHLIRGTAVPDISPLNPKYSQLVAIWRRLPLAIANRLGPLLVRQLG
jgi:FemAB-related protein (PEP-CTERM system-associated)